MVRLITMSNKNKQVTVVLTGFQKRGQVFLFNFIIIAWNINTACLVSIKLFITICYPMLF